MARPFDIHVAVSSEELAKIREYADNLGLTISDAVRLTLREKLRQQEAKQQENKA